MAEVQSMTVADVVAKTMDGRLEDFVREAVGGVVASCKAILLSRATYEMFAPAWSQRTVEDDPGAPFFTEPPKYVVSQTLTDADWNNSTVLGVRSVSLAWRPPAADENSLMDLKPAKLIQPLFSTQEYDIADVRPVFGKEAD